MRSVTDRRTDRQADDRIMMSIADNSVLQYDQLKSASLKGELWLAERERSQKAVQ